MDKYQEAIENFDTAIKLDSKLAVAYEKRGKTKGIMRDYKGALPDFTMAIQLNPEYTEAYYGRGYCKILLKDKKSGCEDINKAISMGFDDPLDLVNKHCM